MRSLLPLALLAAMLAAAPAALAQESNETKPDEQQPENGGNAWTENCPPDMMCAFGGSGEEQPDKAGEPSDDGRVYKDGEDRPTYDGNCGAEVCAYGNDSCIECSGPVDSGGSTCMDGAQENETCQRDDVQYIGGEPNRGPADGSCEYCRGGDGDGEVVPISAPADGAPQAESSGADAKNAVPGLALVGTLGALAVVGFVLRRRA